MIFNVREFKRKLSDVTDEYISRDQLRGMRTVISHTSWLLDKGVAEAFKACQLSGTRDSNDCLLTPARFFGYSYEVSDHFEGTGARLLFHGKVHKLFDLKDYMEEEATTATNGSVRGVMNDYLRGTAINNTWIDEVAAQMEPLEAHTFRMPFTRVNYGQGVGSNFTVTDLHIGRSVEPDRNPYAGTVPDEY